MNPRGSFLAVEPCPDDHGTGYLRFCNLPDRRLGTGTDDMRNRKTETCPRCGTDMIPIVYGFPNADTIRKAERGEVHIGGCLVTPGKPRFHCPNCDRRDDEDDG